MVITIPIDQREAFEQFLRELDIPEPIHYVTQLKGPNAVFTIAATIPAQIIVRFKWKAREAHAAQLERLLAFTPTKAYEKGISSRPIERPLRLPFEDGLGLG